MRLSFAPFTPLCHPSLFFAPFPSFPFNSCVFCFYLSQVALHISPRCATLCAAEAAKTSGARTTIEVSALSGQPLCISTVWIPRDAASSLMRIVTGEQTLLVTVLCVQRSERIGTFVCLSVSSLLLSRICTLIPLNAQSSFPPDRVTLRGFAMRRIERQSGCKLWKTICLAVPSNH